MRFTPSRDYDTILKINKELINTLINVRVVLYKLNTGLTKSNSYGEGTKKTWYQGVEIPCLIDRQAQTAKEENQTVDVEQSAVFAFLRQECIDRDVYPEAGDIIDWDSRYYELDVFTENQLFTGNTEMTHSIVLNGHITRKTNLQLEPPQR